ncbi:hypothetical protein ABIE63_001133 [Limibacillus sp. MBR-115]
MPWNVLCRLPQDDAGSTDRIGETNAPFRGGVDSIRDILKD